MSTIEKLINRMLKLPKDFTYDELIRVLSYYGFQLSNKGKTSGSRVEFINKNIKIKIHIPHPSRIIKIYQLKGIIQLLKENKYL